MIRLQSAKQAGSDKARDGARTWEALVVALKAPEELDDNDPIDAHEEAATLHVNGPRIPTVCILEYWAGPSQI